LHAPTPKIRGARDAQLDNAHRRRSARFAQTSLRLVARLPGSRRDSAASSHACCDRRRAFL